TKLIHPEDKDIVKKGTNDVINNPGKVIDINYRFLKADGTIIYVHSKGEAVCDKRGTPVRIIGVIQDITERFVADQELKREILVREQAEFNAVKSERNVRLLLANREYVREEEQKRIAGEIHDELGSLLTKHFMDISWMQEHPPQSEEELEEKLAEMSSFLYHILGTVRNVASSLRPRILDECGLTAALEGLVLEINQQGNILCSWLETPVEIELDELHRTTLFRICQEAFTNIVRHSGAKQVNISFRLEESMVILEVFDDGIGIGFDEIKNQDSFGIYGMQERALKIGGQFGLERREEGGTRLWVHVPLLNNEIG
ncbi:MAG: PAS domain-containing protein, partial [Magnetococcales bacterium]|nr:PAS domain-containing protein [Magnetococcales bacterium]